MGEVRCPFCGHRWGSLTPQGLFHADIKCGSCRLQFVVELPERTLLYRSSALDLFRKRYGLTSSAAWEKLNAIPVVLRGVQEFVSWDIAYALRPVVGSAWANRQALEAKRPEQRAY